VPRLSTQPYKGTRDFYPEEMRLRRWMFGRLRETVERHGYEEYDGPMLEPFELYAAKTGEEIVNSQLYAFEDRGGRKVAIRPEMTPTLARMVAGKFHELPRPVRWFSTPNLWRYERPQRGRLREHWQLNVDVLGGDPVLADAEVLGLAFELIDGFGGGERIAIRVNHRRLVDHFFREELKLPEGAALKATKAVDAREKVGEERYQAWLLEIGLDPDQARRMDEFFQSPFEATARRMPCEGVELLRGLFAALEGSPARERIVFDPTVMRGLDYYTGTVFEIFDTSPENRRAMFGGGRYDNLLRLFGNESLSGVGFGMGDVTLQNFLETHRLVPALPAATDVFVALPSAGLRKAADAVARELRKAGLRTVTSLTPGAFGTQLKQAQRLQARFTVLLGERELAEGMYLLKNMATGEQSAHGLGQLAPAIRA